MNTVILSLFQITDSFFPTGAFAHSWGFETYVAEGIIRDLERFQEVLKSYILHTIARCDAPAVRFAHEYTGKNDLKALCQLDRLIHTMKFAIEVRQGSIQTGRQLLRLAKELNSKVSLLQEFSIEIKKGHAEGHHSVVFGMICNTMGIPPEESILAYMYTTVSSLVSAAVRLIPLGHTDGQKVIEKLKPLLVSTAEAVFQVDRDELSSFSPGIEIRAMKHERLYTRLFRS